MLFTLFSSASNNTYSLMKEYATSFDITVIYFCFYAVDTFFLLSGFLMAYPRALGLI